MSRCRQGKSKEMLPTGRSAKGVPKFENWFGRFFPKDIAHPVWRHLTKTATDVANLCRAKSDHAAACGKKENGKPVFEFTATEAERCFSIPRPTFSSAMRKLLDIGFLKVTRYGGIAGGKGIPAMYQLSEAWKDWKPPPHDNTNILKARAARGEKGGNG